MPKISNVRMGTNFMVDAMSIPSSTDKEYSSLHMPFKYVSMSPDGQQIITFDPATYMVEVYNTEELVNPISTFVHRNATRDPQNERTCWSLAISNCMDVNNERLIALSRFDACDVGGVNIEFSEMCLNDSNHNKPKTWVIFSSFKSEVKTDIRKIGGVVRFLDNDIKRSCSQPLSDQTTIVIANASGIYKQTFLNSEIEVGQERPALFSRIQFTPDVEQFYLPLKLSTDLCHSDYSQDGPELLQNSIVKNHFLVSSYKNRKHSVEMYDLITGDFEMMFQHHELSTSSGVIHGLPIFAISQNDSMLAFCRGSTTITLFLMENGLEIATKRIVGPGSQKITSMNFVDADDKLLIMLEENESQVFMVWDLFIAHENTESAENAIRSIHLDPVISLKVINKTHKLLNSCGKIIAVSKWGDLSSLLDNPDVKAVINPDVRSNMMECRIVDDEIYYSMFHVNGDRFDASTLGKKKVIISHIEPWQKDRKYVRVSAYLHSNERTQLIIGHDTVQVWSYRRLKDSDLHERVLEYIWAKNGGTKLQICQLLIGEREFVLRLMVPSNEQFDPQPITIHWPNKVNVLEGACRALLVLNKKHDIAGTVNTNRRELLVDHTQRLVRRFMKRNGDGLFRLTDIRYPIMENLIRSHQTKLIQRILKNKKNGKNMRLHIPRLHDWVNVGGVMKLVPKKTDLQIAIECTKHDAIAESLLDYYADNAKDYNNPGWMLTVTQAIPLLYDHKLDNLVQELFRKPCFGTIEAYTPPLHLSRHDRMKGNSTDGIHVLNTKPRLARKPSTTVFTRLTSFLVKQFTRIKNLMPMDPSVVDTTYNDRKIYMVPLPNFTVYPKCLVDHTSNYYSLPFKLLRMLFWPRKRVIKDVNEMSPFLRAIFEDGSTDLHKTPSINAITTFKWKAASHYYTRHVILYVIFGIFFRIWTFKYGTNAGLINVFSTARENIDMNIIELLFLYTGWHLIATEIVELGHKGFRRYFDIYNVFNVISVILPLGLNIADWSFDLDFHLSVTVLSFTSLIMWLELLLLVRYFEAPGRFIYIITNILNTIWPFFAFMLIAVLGFGNAMFILLKNAPASQFHGDDYEVVNSENTTENLYPNLIIKHNVDQNSHLDNYYSNFFSSVKAVFFWTNGRWDQLDRWDNYSVDVMSILGSLILVLIFQNMLIAFMNGAFEKAKEDSHNAVQVFRAGLISEYEICDRPFGREEEFRYIYFIPNPDVIDSWLLYAKKRDVVRAGEGDQPELTESDDDNYADDEVHKKHVSESSSASKKTEQIYSSEHTVNLVDKENTTESKGPSVHHSLLKRLGRSYSTTTTPNNRSYTTLENNNNNKNNNNNNNNNNNKGSTSSIGVGEGATPPKQTVTLHEKIDDLEYMFSQRTIGFSERFDALEQKLTTVLEFLSDQ